MSSVLRVERGLLLLALRRMFPLPVVAATLLVAAGFALAHPASVSAPIRRETTWTALALVALPLALHAAASLGRRWRLGDRAWLGSRAVSRGTVALSAWLGTWIGAIALFGGIALLAEVGREDGGARRRLRALESPRAALVEPGARTAWSAGELGDGEGLLLHLALGTAPGSGPTATIRATCTRGAESSTAEALVFGRSSIEVEVPRGHGEVRIEVAKPGPGCTVVLAPGALSLHVAEDRAGLASFELFLRWVLFVGAWTALAMGIGAWMRASVATALALAAALPVLGAGRGAAWLPGADLATALAEAGDGLIPPHAPVIALFGFAVLALSGIALAARGLDAGAGDAA